MSLGVRKIKLLGVAAMAILALGASGCSSLPSAPDWVDPTTWFSGDDSADTGQTPDLASLPDKPAAETADETQKTVESLAADRTNAKYSAEALRGGTEPAASPPADVAPASVADNDTPVVSAPKSASPTRVAADEVRPTVDRSISQDPSGSAVAGTLPATRPGTAVAAVTPPAEPVQTAALAPAAEKPAKPVKTAKRAKPARVAAAPEATAPDSSVPEASTPEPSAPPPVKRRAARPSTPRVAQQTAPAVAEPSAPAVARPSAPPVVYQRTASVSPSDAELGFKPSSAPPLDPSVSQFVSAPIVDHYRRTAASAGMGTARVVSPAPSMRSGHRRSRGVAMGGPEGMEGKVVANLDAIGSAPVAVQANMGGSATAVVYFPHDSVGLGAEGRAQVRAAVEQYNATGRQGYVRVIGHSSSRTADMSAERHLALVFRKSQYRANAVARALIRAGIPADRVLVEAVGDTQPIYYESMPKGEEGNRRAEIFVEG